MLYRSVLNGMLVQDRNASIQSAADLKVVTDKAPTIRD